MSSSRALARSQLPLFVVVHHSHMHLYAKHYCIYLPLFLNDIYNNRSFSQQSYQKRVQGACEAWNAGHTWVRDFESEQCITLPSEVEMRKKSNARHFTQSSVLHKHCAQSNVYEYFLLVLRSEYHAIYLTRAKFFLLSKKVVIAKNVNYKYFLETIMFFVIYTSHTPDLFIDCISCIYLINLYFKQIIIVAPYLSRISIVGSLLHLISHVFATEDSTSGSSSNISLSKLTHGERCEEYTKRRTSSAHKHEDFSMGTMPHLALGLEFQKKSNVNCNDSFYSAYNLKSYAILIPLYQETNQVLSIIKHFYGMLYPEELMDVRLLVEERDVEMMEFVQTVSLPHFMSVFVIPNDVVLTKPKALNYAAHFIESEYLVIYDAEDRPEYDQLYRAIMKFQQVDEKCICLQARLSFLNSYENLITFWISVEYILWFNFILPGLEFCRMPLTLGGTSNHFKTDKIKEIGYWDAYNVTEDAELGLRIYAQQYVVSMLDSVTHAEAVVSLKGWLGQRARWSKGFIQTFFIFLKMYNKYGEMKLYHQLMIIIFTGVHAAQFLFVPLIVLISYIYDIKYIGGFCLVSFLLFSYANAICAIRLSLLDLPNKLLCALAIATYPAYFLLHVFATYIAVFELYYNPFYWCKTMHGLSKKIKL
ncbi:Glycosyl transferase 2 family protein [Rickettsiales endosymbiont of Paramecium tredecaurelia]|uniref:glycosyltransferase family 2 protein n=1 Tax=Candidatus Sarmatiella mevalonica TaxID=2770581 RepID=UPI001924C897|nr:glycosyltransferase family 2 protein [Candidatus Sarmatiella mevalonica]MBL3284900.1 Glycosyl transferase 2 family protein [Candidatus Sarmatiella mevalonica]